VLQLHGGHKKLPCCILGLQSKLGRQRQLEFRLALQVPGIQPAKLPAPRFLNLAAEPTESAVLDAMTSSQYLTLGPMYRGLFSYNSFAHAVATFYLRGIKVSLDEQLVPVVEWTGAGNPIHAFAHPSEQLVVS
jgi:hypothetical protein